MAKKDITGSLYDKKFFWTDETKCLRNFILLALITAGKYIASSGPGCKRCLQFNSLMYKV